MKILKSLFVSIVLLLVIVLISATILEKLFGTDFSNRNIYHSYWFVILWGILAIVSVIYLVRYKIGKKLFVYSLHFSLLIILLGAFFTWTTSTKGIIHLRIAEKSNVVQVSKGKNNLLPFYISLIQFKVIYYPSTETPMDYESSVQISDGKHTLNDFTAMNRIFKYKHYRFYQTAYDSDSKGTTLSVRYDPYGIAFTYFGYVLLFVSMAGFLFDKGCQCRKLWHQLKSESIITIFLLCLLPLSSSAEIKTPKTIPLTTAETMGNLYVLYNGRICPLQTVAKDFTLKIYGRSSYKGLTCEQVLAGWIFYPVEWSSERLPDKDKRKENQRLYLIQTLYTGQLLKIFPYRTSKGIRWYAQGDELPKNMEPDIWMFIRKSPDYLFEKICTHNYKGADEVLIKWQKYQAKTAVSILPSKRKFKAEKIYNSITHTKTITICCLLIGIISYTYYIIGFIRRKKAVESISLFLKTLWAAIFAYLTMQIILRGYISGYLPVSSGYETMQLMAWSTLFISRAMQKRFPLFLPVGFLLSGFFLLVSMFGESDPPITPLMPVLMSPLLSIHVVIIMISYVLFGFLSLNGITALILHSRKENFTPYINSIYLLSRILLYPAVFCLTAGIFIGAIWANISWGQYWSWDPKETWALITLMIYAMAFHADFLPVFRHPLFFHAYTAAAFICVLITYFGVNFLLGGMHSYA